MHAKVGEIRTLEELRRYIHESLCAKENLVPDEFAISEVRLIRSGRMCGMQFCLRGPRSVRLAAIWAADRNAVYLYDAKGQRYAKIVLPGQLVSPAQAPAA